MQGLHTYMSTHCYKYYTNRHPNSLRRRNQTVLPFTPSVPQMCFKVGRTTVPPVIVFAANGLSVPSSQDPSHESDLTSDTSTNARTYSHTNPPAHCDSVNVIASKLHEGSVKSFRSSSVVDGRMLPRERDCGRRRWAVLLSSRDDGI
ncbi:hypothetical protein BT96DRAFT_21979 [Gymnopus androsaceus JB14]|uniref:Uncharacterized protein n=1 Tax=Gymnopus androsaceus JB14 TaxID=1447944 RepID=A0A6A4I7U7_9AGAR|nr:hypothetical protein BT96DRAFT_21979 [Gymnopus androsaceus JB14]